MSAEILHCPKCNRACNGKRGFAIHVNKCTMDVCDTKKCTHCCQIFSTSQVKERHLAVCIPYALFKKEEEHQAKLQDIKDAHAQEIDTLKLQHKSEMEALADRHKLEIHALSSGDCTSLLDKIAAFETQVATLKQDKIKRIMEMIELRNQLDEKNDEIESLEESLQEARNTTVTTTNTTTNMNIQIFTLSPVDVFNLRSKIAERTITNNPMDMLDFLEEQGITGLCHITDSGDQSPCPDINSMIQSGQYCPYPYPNHHEPYRREEGSDSDHEDSNGSESDHEDTDGSEHNDSDAEL